MASEFLKNSSYILSRILIGNRMTLPIIYIIKESWIWLISLGIFLDGNSKVLLFRSEILKYALSNTCIIHIYFILIISETAAQKCLFPYWFYILCLLHICFLIKFPNCIKIIYWFSFFKTFFHPCWSSYFLRRPQKYDMISKLFLTLKVS